VQMLRRLICGAGKWRVSCCVRMLIWFKLQ
jgi:hypothetical protein